MSREAGRGQDATADDGPGPGDRHVTQHMMTASRAERARAKAEV